MRRVLPIVLGVILVGAGLFGLIKLFGSRDSSQLQAPAAAQAPGTAEPAGMPGDPPTSGEPGTEDLKGETTVSDPVLLRALAVGDVALVYGTPKPPPGLEQLRDDATGPFDAGLAAAGQMAFLVRRKGVKGVQALAWQRRLEVADPSDPRLREFVDVWLGKGRGDTG